MLITSLFVLDGGSWKERLILIVTVPESTGRCMQDWSSHHSLKVKSCARMLSRNYLLP